MDGTERVFFIILNQEPVAFIFTGKIVIKKEFSGIKIENNLLSKTVMKDVNVQIKVKDIWN